MLYKLAEGERQRRPRPIQRPQCSSSHMPSIPMCCVKVEPAESSGWTFLRRATLNTHTDKAQTTPLDASQPPRFCLCFSVILCGEKSLTKMPGLTVLLTPCSILLNEHDVYLFPYNPAVCLFFFKLSLVQDNPLISTIPSHVGADFHQNSLAKFFFSVTRPKNLPQCQITH